MYYVYVLRTKNGFYYVGSTSNVEKRIKSHIDGYGAEYTRRNGVTELLRVETYSTLVEARQREKQIKGWSRLKKENLVKYGRPIT